MSRKGHRASIPATSADRIEQPLAGPDAPAPTSDPEAALPDRVRAGTAFLTVNIKPPSGRAACLAARPGYPEAATDGSASLATPLLGDYELLAIVGQGGMGIVYKARHRTLNRIVALKVTRDDHLLSAEMAQRFQIEATAIAKLDHPHIVPIYEIGQTSGQQFYSMAFVEGTSLANEVAVSPLPPRRAAELMKPVAQAIAYAHTQGVVHRDLKPDNILLDRAERPRITDFGIAKFSDTDSRLTQAGEVMGTPSYMPPEQALGHADKVGPLSDVYALGASLYCLLTGRPPFQAATPLDTMKYVIEREPVSPRQLNPAVDRDLETICLKCLEKAPESRYASATALAEDLQRFLDHRPILARPVPALGKAARWCRRNKFVAGSLASIVAVFLTAFALVSWSYWRAEEALREEAQQREAANQARDATRRHEQAERWERYRANLGATASAFQSRNVSAARRALEDAPPEHRNWEWQHFRQQIDCSQQVLPGEGKAIDRMRFAANHRLVTLGGSLRVWDLATGRLLRALQDYHTRTWPLFDVDASGRWLAYPLHDNTIALWDLVADRRHTVLHGAEGSIASLHVGTDGTTLAACRLPARVHVWDTASGKHLRSWSLPESPQEILGFDVDGNRILVSNLTGGIAALWDIPTGRPQALLSSHQAQVITAAFNPQGTRIVTSEGYPSNLLRLWDAETGKQIALLRGHSNQAPSVRFSPDGTRLASCSFDQTIHLWDGLTGAPLATLQGHAGRVVAIAFSPDGSRLVSASQDCTLRLWDAIGGELIAVLCGHAAEVTTVAYSADGSLIASGSTDGTTRMWDARLAERNGVLRGHTSFVYGVAFHPDSERLASVSWDGTLRLWHATSGQQTAVLPSPEKTMLNSVALNAAGDLLATLGRDNAVRLREMATGKQLQHWSVPTDNWQDGRVTFSPRGDLLAAGSVDGGVYLWDVSRRTSAAVLRGHRAAVHDVAFSPDGHWLASAGADEDNSIRIWDVARKEQRQVLQSHAAGVMALAFSRKGDILASGSKDGTVRFWNTATWESVAVLKHGTTVYSVAFTPDGSRLATGCADNSIRFWDVATRQEVAELRGHSSYVKALSFSGDGSRLASASGDGTVRVWDKLSARERQRREQPGEER